MNQQDRAVTPVVATILMVAIVVILAATVSVFFFDVAENIRQPAPNVADTTGEFEPEPEIDSFRNDQIVRITHIAGEDVAVEELEIVVRASGPDDDLPTEARLVNLPADDNDIDDENIQGNIGLIDKGSKPIGGAAPPNLLITDQDTNVWSAGKTIQFRIRKGGADFTDEPGRNPEADELEIVIIHTPSNAIISENTFRP